MKRASRTLTIIAIILVIFQIIGILGNSNAKKPNLENTNKVAYYIGYNFPIILALILFFIAWRLKKKAEKKDSYKMIDSIGKEK